MRAVNVARFLTSGSGTSRQLLGNALDNVIDTSQLTESYNFNYSVILDGGAGADVLIGSQHSDIYVVDNSGDQVFERNFDLQGFAANVDTVRSSVTWTLGANLENLELTGTSAISGTGNSLGNRIDGSTNSAANILTGLAGDDTYTIGAGDTVVEAAGGGNDTVRLNRMVAGGQVLLSDFANVENLTLLAAAGVTNLVGTAGNNTLMGNNLGGTIDGGAGNDRVQDYEGTGGIASGGTTTNTLLGGDGNDTIHSGGGVDILDGGLGDDAITVAGTSSSTLRYALGDGRDTFTSSSTVSHSLVFGAGVTTANVIFSRSVASPNWLIITFSGSPNDRIEIRGFFDNAGAVAGVPSIGSVRFADGTVWTTADIVARLSSTPQASITHDAAAIGAAEGTDADVAPEAVDTVEPQSSSSKPIQQSNRRATGIEIGDVAFDDSAAGGIPINEPPLTVEVLPDRGRSTDRQPSGPIQPVETDVPADQALPNTPSDDDSPWSDVDQWQDAADAEPDEFSLDHLRRMRERDLASVGDRHVGWWNSDHSRFGSRP